MAYKAARQAMDGGEYFSNGAYFWDGWDIKTNYTKHFKVRQGIKISDPSHNIFSIQDNLVLIIKKKITLKRKNGKAERSEIEIGRYDHVYESTAAHGGTIFWKFNPEYIALEKAKEYK
jgi:hypothetical protein